MPAAKKDLGEKKLGNSSLHGALLYFPFACSACTLIAKLFECLPVSRVYFHVTVREVERFYLHFPSAEPKRSDAF